MAKTSASKSAARGSKLRQQARSRSAPGGRRPFSAVRRPAGLSSARRGSRRSCRRRNNPACSGGKSGRIGGRVSPALVEQAKRQTGIETDTDLIEFALATVALEDNFAETFKASLEARSTRI